MKKLKGRSDVNPTKRIYIPHTNTRRGHTQENKNAVHKKAHSPGLLSGIPTLHSKMGVAWMRGFTLIELLVVVLIIGILAAVALPQYNKAVKKAHGTEALTALDALDKALTSYYLENGTYQGVSTESLGVTIPDLHHLNMW